MGLSSKQVSEVGDLDIPVVAVDEINNNNNEAIRAPRRGRTSETKGTPALKCPRCDSSNTKFCYYNNYSRLQPRHFCRACKRHWTAGGTLRSVPVGGSSRRTKSTTAPKHHNNNTTAQLQQQPFVVPFNTGDTEAGAVFPDIFSRLFCPADYAAGSVFSSASASASASSSNSSMHGLQESSANLMGGCYNDFAGWLQDDYLSIPQHPPPANFWNYSNLDDGAFMDFLGTNH